MFLEGRTNQKTRRKRRSKGLLLRVLHLRYATRFGSSRISTTADSQSVTLIGESTSTAPDTDVPRREAEATNPNYEPGRYHRHTRHARAESTYLLQTHAPYFPTPAMISFNTFTGQLHDPQRDGDNTKIDLGAKERLGSDEHGRGGSGVLPDSSNDECEDARSDISTDQPAESAADRYDLFHERSTRKHGSNTATQPSRNRRKSRNSKRGNVSEEKDVGCPPPIVVKPVEMEHQQQQQQGGRVLQLFHLLTFKNQAGDAKSALIQKLIAVTNVKELIMSKATQDQIASAANDAITDEILATVDLEDKRRQSMSNQLASSELNSSKRVGGCAFGGHAHVYLTISVSLPRFLRGNTISRSESRFERFDRHCWPLQPVPCAGTCRRARLDDWWHGEADSNQRPTACAIFTAVREKRQ